MCHNRARMKILVPVLHRPCFAAERIGASQGIPPRQKFGDNSMMTKDQLLMLLVTATPEELTRWFEFAENKDAPQVPSDRKLLTLAAAAEVLGVSRQTVLRMTKDGRLPVVETRAGRFRVPSYALTALLKGGAA